MIPNLIFIDLNPNHQRNNPSNGNPKQSPHQPKQGNNLRVQYNNNAYWKYEYFGHYNVVEPIILKFEHFHGLLDPREDLNSSGDQINQEEWENPCLH